MILRAMQLLVEAWRQATCSLAQTILPGGHASDLLLVDLLQHHANLHARGSRR
jgi:hypothetical protein